MLIVLTYFIVQLYGKYQTALHGIIFGFGYYSDSYFRNRFLYSVKIQSDGTPVVAKVATLPESELSSYDSFDIPYQWVGLEISADDILIFDGGSTVDPVLCDLSSDAGTSVIELMILSTFPYFTFFGWSHHLSR